jgi:DNA-binding LacI/PurR family transcriptional regulator
MEIPLVLLNCSPSETVCDMVVPDNQGGIVKSLDHLLANGHTRIAFFGTILSGGKMDDNLRRRKEMFENESKVRGLPMRHDYVKIASIKHASVKETEKMISETLSFWANLPQVPTAVICYNDLYAKLLLRASAEMGIKIPDDLSVIGTDNTDECEYTYPALTSIDHDPVEMGRLAAELLLKRINHSERTCTRTNCDSRLVVRKSTGPAKSK